MSFINFISFMILLSLLIFLSGMLPAVIYAMDIIPDNELGNFHVSSFQTFLVPALLLPLIEEMLFRLNLKISMNNLLIFFILIFGILLFRAFKLNQSDSLFLFIIPFIFIAILVYYKFYPDQKIKKYLHNFWVCHFGIIFHSSCWIFALLHLINFEEITPTLLFLSPLIVLPQLILAYALGFLRMNYGFQYNVIFHVIYNSLFSLSFIQ